MPLQPGIWISRRIKSGLSCAARSIACTPVSASPTTSRSVCEPSIWRNRLRAAAWPLRATTTHSLPRVSASTSNCGFNGA